MLKLSLIVPSYNRAEYLKESLETFAAQSLDKCSYEIILVNNNSSDDTRGVFEKFHQKYHEHNWVYYFEPKQGLHFARNRGILLAKGDIVVFGDDDIKASPSWLEAILMAFEKDEEIGIVGGPIYPLWNGEPPSWIYDYGTKDVHAVFAYHNYGDESKYLEKEYVYGCNFAIRKQLAIDINGSGPDTFPPHMIHYSGSGESAMQLRVMAKGYRIFYETAAAIVHNAPASRCNMDYFIDRYRRWAVESIYHKYNTGMTLFNIFKDLRIQSKHFLIMLIHHRSLKNKINKKYFLIIKAKYLLFSWKHFIKMIFDSEMRNYTKKTNYLAEFVSRSS